MLFNNVPFFPFKNFGSIFQTQSRGIHHTSPTSLTSKHPPKKKKKKSSDPKGGGGGLPPNTPPPPPPKKKKKKNCFQTGEGLNTPPPCTCLTWTMESYRLMRVQGISSEVLIYLIMRRVQMFQLIPVCYKYLLNVNFWMKMIQSTLPESYNHIIPK